MKSKSTPLGFTLIEVLLALAIVAIALTALLKATAQNVTVTQRLQDKIISHWVGLQGIFMVQLGMISLRVNQESTQSTTMLGQKWYWRATLQETATPYVEQIIVRLSKNQAGPFADPLIGYKYHHE